MTALLAPSRSPTPNRAGTLEFGFWPETLLSARSLTSYQNHFDFGKKFWQAVQHRRGVFLRLESGSRRDRLEQKCARPWHLRYHSTQISVGCATSSSITYGAVDVAKWRWETQS
jgi:hypothetical protein